MSMGVSDCYVHVGTLARWHAAVIGLWVGVIHTKRQGARQKRQSGHSDTDGELVVSLNIQAAGFSARILLIVRIHGRGLGQDEACPVSSNL